MTYAALFNELTSSIPRKSGRPMAAPGLSEEQLVALNAPFSESAVICAGAGAGKTKLLVERVTALLRIGVKPERLAVVAFTRKSAAEIISRVKSKIGTKAAQPVCSTVHALAYSLLMKAGVAISLAEPADELAALAALQDLIPPALEDTSPADLLLALNRAREEFDKSSALGILGLAYEEVLLSKGLSDFTTILNLATEKIRNLFDDIIIDESQDLSQLQLKFLRSIGPKAVYWFIGDPDQAIYAFRGASADMMSTLKAESAAVYYLTTNFRSATKVVACANQLIQNNPRSFNVAWKASRELMGEVSVRSFSSAEAEFEDTVKWLSERPKERAALGRTQALVARYKAIGLPAYTVHESKGLEWPQIRVLGCEEGLFPHPMSAAQEERRLFYVAMTRARDTLEMTYCHSRSKNNRAKPRSPSRFLLEAQV